jgi:hypothetical protein
MQLVFKIIVFFFRRDVLTSVKVAAFRVVTPYKKINKICSIVVILEIAICPLCGLFPQAKCFLFKDSILAEHDLYYNYIKRKHQRNRKIIKISNWKSVKMFVGWIMVQLRSYYSSTLYKCVCVRALARMSSAVVNNNASCVI